MVFDRQMLQTANTDLLRVGFHFTVQKRLPLKKFAVAAEIFPPTSKNPPIITLNFKFTFTCLMSQENSIFDTHYCELWVLMG